MKQKLKATPLMMVLFKDVNLLEHDAGTQYKFNRWWAIFWLLQMICLPVFILTWNTLWLKIDFFYVTEASLWANFSTHFGAMSSALAARNTSKTVADVADDVDDIKDDVSNVADVLAA